MRLGVLDIGSNTVHLLIVDAHHGAAPVPALSHKLELRLAEHLDEDGRIDSEASDALVGFIKDSLEIAEDAGVTEVTAFATSAIREAPNGDDVLDQVKRRTGVEVDLMSGPREAQVTFLAVRRWFGWSSGRLLVVDIGGGSLELASGADEDPDVALSLPLGAGRLTRDHLSDDPPKAGELKALRKKIRADVAAEVGRLIRFGQPEMAVATSKTLRQLARIAGAAPSAEGLYVRRVLTRSDLGVWLPKLSEMTASKRAELPGVSQGRSRQLVAGALVAEAVMDIGGLPELVLCPWALREGVILERLDALAPGS
ncbi:MAG: Ppx/GppA family phosphatase [Actinobacteria bacterium]|nr:Ppx/GppA family phosphatase [Actinomycetota bacterium]MCB8998116.1 Ppx/GppA family phosphatase [Actinomycetota bacterium]MCB9415443.1 Ppx/GppA family phosphatase [Actinomycetota bacterium]MCB9424974.1 Ppx/GppA family phosphatase [Actinomycetota bacterium]HRY09649.1 Ppx/GppA phosphatase family protein [Candidatus Nanopelagicales bacterium]